MSTTSSRRRALLVSAAIAAAAAGASAVVPLPASTDGAIPIFDFSTCGNWTSEKGISALGGLGVSPWLHSLEPTLEAYVPGSGPQAHFVSCTIAPLECSISLAITGPQPSPVPYPPCA